MNDLQSLQHCGTGFEDGRRQAESDKASSALIMLLFSFIFRAFSFIILFCPGILCAYIILDKLKYNPGNMNGWKYVGALVAIVYVMECLIFIFKGRSISLKEKGNELWVIPWLFCFLYCFAFPAFMLHTLIFLMFRPVPGHPTNTLNIVSWVVGALISVYIYSRYHLQSDTAPKLMGWAYRIGKRF